MIACRSLAVLALVLGPASIATATSDAGLPCAYLPGADVSPIAGEIPANWPVLEIRITGSSSGWPQLIRTSDREVVLLEIVSGPSPMRLLVTEELIVGEVYELVHPLCDGEMRRTEYVVVPPIDPPTALGTITVSDLYAVHRSRGSATLRHFVDVVLTTDPSMSPWLGAYQWRVLDGARTSDAQPLFEARIEMDVDCGVRDVDREHVFRATAGIATEALFESEEVGARFDCWSATIVHAGTRVPMTPDEIEAFESFVPVPDAIPPVMPMPTGACTCSTPGGGPRRGALGAGAAIALLVIGAVRARAGSRGRAGS